MNWPVTRYDQINPIYKKYGGMMAFHEKWVRNEISEDDKQGKDYAPAADIVSPSALAFVVACLNGVRVPEEYYR